MAKKFRDELAKDGIIAHSSMKVPTLIRLYTNTMWLTKRQQGNALTPETSFDCYLSDKCVKKFLYERKS